MKWLKLSILLISIVVATVANAGSNSIQSISSSNSKAVSSRSNNGSHPIMNHITVKNNYTYATQGIEAELTNEFIILDVSTPSSIKVVGSLDALAPINTLDVTDDYAVMASDTDIYYVDISTPDTPTLVYTDHFSGVTDISIAGNFVYFTRATSLFVVDLRMITLPNSEQEITAIPTDFTLKRIEVIGSYAYLLGTKENISDYNLQIVDISSPLSPTLKGDYYIESSSNESINIQVSGNNAYITDDSNGLQVINISNPDSPQFVTNYSDFQYTEGSSTGIRLDGTYIYLKTTLGFDVLDISNLSNIQKIASYENGYFNALSISGNSLYTTDTDGNLLVIDKTNLPTLNLVATYNTTTNNNDSAIQAIIPVIMGLLLSDE